MNEMELIDLGEATSQTKDFWVIPEFDEASDDYDKVPDAE